MYIQLLQAAHSSDVYENVLREVQNFLDQGEPHETILAVLTDVVAELRASNKDEAEEIVLDVMDRLAGWCNPDLKL